MKPFIFAQSISAARAFAEEQDLSPRQYEILTNPNQLLGTHDAVVLVVNDWDSKDLEYFQHLFKITDAICIQVTL